MLSSFRYKFILVFAVAVVISISAGSGIFSRRSPEQISVLPRDGAEVFLKFLSKQAPSLSDVLVKTKEALLNHSKEIEALTGFILSKNPSISYRTALRVASALKYNSSKYGVPLDLVVGVAYIESRFYPRARSSYGAAGLMQVVWRVHSFLLMSYGIHDEYSLFEPEGGAAAGCIMLSRYIADSDNLVMALGRYYGGDGNSYWLKISRAMREYREFKKIFEEGRDE